MAVVERVVREVAVQRQSRAIPAWLDFLRALGFLLVVVPLAVLQGFLFGQSDPEKYRPFAPGNRNGGAE